jgi:hypothetical protein
MPIALWDYSAATGNQFAWPMRSIWQLQRQTFFEVIGGTTGQIAWRLVWRENQGMEGRVCGVI